MPSWRGNFGICKKGNVDDLSENACGAYGGCLRWCVDFGRAAGRAAFELNGTFTRDVSCPVDFPCILDELEIDDNFSTTGNVIIDGIIGVGGEDEPLVVEDDAIIGGALIISPTGAGDRLGCGCRQRG